MIAMISAQRGSANTPPDDQQPPSETPACSPRSWNAEPPARSIVPLSLRIDVTLHPLVSCRFSIATGPGC